MNRQRVFCPDCGAGQVCGPLELVDLLRSRGMLRREAEPDELTVQQLLSESLPRINCPDCGRDGLQIDDACGSEGDNDDEWDAWESGANITKLCAGCRQPIPPERLELFPDSTRCAACEEAPAKEEADYCPRCGSIMTLRTAGSGVTRYQLYCPNCRR